MASNQHKYHQRRYRLHRMARRHGVKIDVNNRDIDISPYSSFHDYPVPGRYYIGQLIKLGYTLQYKLFK